MVVVRERDVPPVACDMAVVGGGIAGISAALEACESGAEVVLLEKAPESERIGLPSDPFLVTLRAYNVAVDRDAPFDPDRKDGKAARGIGPPKSNWALPIGEPAYRSVAVSGRITLTFGGLKTDEHARVLDIRDHVMPGLYAAGETQGEFFYFNYPGATSCLRGVVFGRIAGRHAAIHVLGRP